MVNSNWTKDHIDSLWGLRRNGGARVVFPPCNTVELQVGVGAGCAWGTGLGCWCGRGRTCTLWLLLCACSVLRLYL